MNWGLQLHCSKLSECASIYFRKEHSFRFFTRTKFTQVLSLNKTIKPQHSSFMIPQNQKFVNCFRFVGFPSILSIRLHSKVSNKTEISSNNNLLSVNKKLIMAAKSAHNQKPVKQKYDFYLVLDFEATCDKTAQPSPQEIIEFPVLKVNANTMKIEAVFHKYVRPQFHPQLTTFCTELTGIIQSMVDNQPLFPEVLQSFHQWMESENLLNPDIKSIFVTCGDWDLKTMLPKQCAYLDVDVKPYFSQWINIKKSFAEVTSIYPKGLMVMLNNLNLKHTGRHHSGIDDCHNIANILIALLQKGHTF